MFQVSSSIKFLQVSSYTPLKTGYKIKRMHTLSQSSICECLYLCCMKQSTAFECKHPVLSLGFDGMFVQDTQTQRYHSTKNYKQKKLRSFFFQLNFKNDKASYFFVSSVQLILNVFWQKNVVSRYCNLLNKHPWCFGAYSKYAQCTYSMEVGGEA